MPACISRTWDGVSEHFHQHAYVIRVRYSIGRTTKRSEKGVERLTLGHFDAPGCTFYHTFSGANSIGIHTYMYSLKPRSSASASQE